jgi:hypothetical protein
LPQELVFSPAQEVFQKETPMSDFRNDPNFANHGTQDFDNRVQWAAVAVILLLVGGLIVAAAWTGGETQTAMNGPSVETTGSSVGSTATDPPRPRMRP